MKNNLQFEKIVHYGTSIVLYNTWTIIILSWSADHIFL